MIVVNRTNRKRGIGMVFYQCICNVFRYAILDCTAAFAALDSCAWNKMSTKRNTRGWDAHALYLDI